MPEFDVKLFKAFIYDPWRLRQFVDSDESDKDRERLASQEPDLTPILDYPLFEKLKRIEKADLLFGSENVGGSCHDIKEGEEVVGIGAILEGCQDWNAFEEPTIYRA